jgi:Protein of unknown function (DUF3237)
VNSGQVARDFPPSSELRASDGSVLRWGDSDAPGPGSLVPPGTAANVTVAVSPVRVNHAVTVDYRVDGGPVREVIATRAPCAANEATRLFRAILPGQSIGLVEFLPVLRLFGRPISPRLLDSTDRATYRVGGGPAPIDAKGSSTPRIAAPEGQPRWDWRARFVGSLSAALAKEPIGVTPEGLRIAWLVEQGRFVGPRLTAVMLPGATDWMRIRADGVGIISVRACLQTATGARIYMSYGGMLDLGSDGYARALRGEFDPCLPLVVAPTFETSDESLSWLNRAQCIGVGKAFCTAQIAFDVYLVEAGGEKVAKLVNGALGEDLASTRRPRDFR